VVHGLLASYGMLKTKRCNKYSKLVFFIACNATDLFNENWRQAEA